MALLGQPYEHLTGVALVDHCAAVVLLVLEALLGAVERLAYLGRRVEGPLDLHRVATRGGVRTAFLAQRTQENQPGIEATRDLRGRLYGLGGGIRSVRSNRDRGNHPEREHPRLV